MQKAEEYAEVKEYAQDMPNSNTEPKNPKLYPRDPCIQIIPRLGPKVCKNYLHWAIWIPRLHVKP